MASKLVLPEFFGTVSPLGLIQTLIRKEVKFTSIPIEQKIKIEL